MVLASLAALTVGGCTPAQYARQADAVAYGVMAAGQQVVSGHAQARPVDYDPYIPGPDGIITVSGKRIPVGRGEPVQLNLFESVAIALRNSRGFQDRREDLYMAALAVGSSRRDWNWRLVQGQVGAELFGRQVNRGGETLDLTSDNEISLTRRFAQGGVLTLAAGLQVLSDLLGGTDTTTGSLVSANFTQPLLQGAWRGIAYEEQYRIERDFLFSVFEYDRFTQTFIADVVTRYWRVMQQRDLLENETENIKRLEQTLELTRVLVKGGQVSPIEADQAEQNLLDARIRQQENAQNYRDDLDSFKLLIGLPLAAQAELNYPQDLADLKAEAVEIGGLPELPMDEAAAVRMALNSRPEVLRGRAEVRDADRNITLAADEFLPQLDLQLGLSVPGTEPTDFTRLQVHRHTREARLRLFYPIDQTANRDRYRLAILVLQRARRDLDLQLDQIVLDVRQAYRSLLRTSRTYAIRLRSVQIAERRRTLAVLQQKQGQASARDVLEAEEALRNSQNGLTAAIVTYTTTRLRFLASLGMLGVDEEGVIYERPEPIQFDRLQRIYPYLGPPPGADDAVP